ETDLDRAAARLVEVSLTAEEATRELYGEVRCNASPTTVYVAASGKDSGKPYGKAGFGVYWGVADARNTSCRIGEGSENRAALMAILYAILAVPEDCSLVIYTSSQYAIRSYCYWAGEYATAGWVCAHGDVLQRAAASIQRRTAPIRF
ncbi:hypothetical protein DFH09DRAFT_888136, partial [Mycena vulgaris]